MILDKTADELDGEIEAHSLDDTSRGVPDTTVAQNGLQRIRIVPPRIETGTCYATSNYPRSFTSQWSAGVGKR